MQSPITHSGSITWELSHLKGHGWYIEIIIEGLKYGQVKSEPSYVDILQPNVSF